jgi:hypothetical protein
MPPSCRAKRSDRSVLCGRAVSGQPRDGERNQAADEPDDHEYEPQVRVKTEADRRVNAPGARYDK